MSTRKAALTAIVVVGILIAAGVQYWRTHQVVMPASPIVVVMPAKVSGESSDVYWGEAIASLLSRQLEAVADIDVEEPPTVTEVDEVAGSPKRVALAYGANVVITPTIAVEPDHYHLEIKVVDPVTENVVWTRPFDGNRAATLQTIHQAGEELRKLLRPGAAPLSPVELPAGIDAELAYQEGEHYLDQFNNKYGAEDFSASLQGFQHALELNPKFADAAAEIARLNRLQIEASGSLPSLVTEVQNWVRQALLMDPKCGRAHFVLSTIDESKALESALRAAMFAPDFAPGHLALASAMASSSGLGLAASRQARQTEPLYLFAPVTEAGYLHQLGRTSEAFAMLDRHVLSIDPTMSYGRLVEASLMIELGWLDRAEPIFKSLEKELAEHRVMPLTSSVMRQRYAITQREFGSFGLNSQRLVAMVNDPKATPLEITVAMESVPSLANSSHIDDSFEVLNRAVKMGVVIPYDWLRGDKRLEKLRRDGRFGPIMNRSREQFEALMKALDEAKARGELPAYLEQPITEVKSQIGN